MEQAQPVEHGADPIVVDFRGVPSTIREVRVGWKWRGIHVPALRVRDALQQPREIRVDSPPPAQGASLWWTWADDTGLTWPPVESVPMDGVVAFTVGG